MIDLYSADRNLKTEEVWRFLDKHDYANTFSSRYTWKDNFNSYFDRLVPIGHVLTLRESEDNSLAGICTWIIIDDATHLEVNKVAWKIPQEIRAGDILYISVCIVKHGVGINAICHDLRRRYENDLFPSRIGRVMWINIPRGKVFRATLKGGTQCPEGQTAG